MASEPGQLLASAEGQRVYGNLAWKLNRLGVESTLEATARAEAGRAWHQEHGATVARSDTASRVRDLAIILSLLTAAAAASTVTPCR